MCAIKISITISCEQKRALTSEHCGTTHRFARWDSSLSKTDTSTLSSAQSRNSLKWLNSTAQRGSREKLQLNGLFYISKKSPSLFLFLFFIKLDFLSLCLLSTSFRLSFPILELRPLPNWTVRWVHITTTTTKFIIVEILFLTAQHCDLYQAQHTYIHTTKMWELK